MATASARFVRRRRSVCVRGGVTSPVSRTDFGEAVASVHHSLAQALGTSTGEMPVDVMRERLASAADTVAELNPYTRVIEERYSKLATRADRRPAGARGFASGTGITHPRDLAADRFRGRAG